MSPLRFAALTVAVLAACRAPDGPPERLLQAPQALGPVLPGDSSAVLIDSSGSALVLDATVQFLDIEGGCWTLKTPAARYLAAGIPLALRHEGQLLRTWVRTEPRTVTACQVGELIFVDSAAAR